jgi:hypothetical protein
LIGRPIIFTGRPGVNRDGRRASLAAAGVSARAGKLDKRHGVAAEPLQEDLGGVVGRGVGLEDLLGPGSMMTLEYPSPMDR